jgi:hypothetical protein
MRDILSIIIAVLVLLAVFNYKTIFQEGNPWPQAEGIAELIFSDNDLVNLSSAGRYLSWTDNGRESFIESMEEKGYRFVDQLGSGYFFENSSGDQVLATSRQYSRWFSLWNIEDADSYLNDLPERLAACLPKSDQASHEECQELLNHIQDFSTCVSAGFQEDSNDPSACSTPDGRSFVASEDDQWQAILAAADDCQIESVFQAHSLDVSATLKDGRVLKGKEPAIDMITETVSALEDRCGQVSVATE